MKYYATVVISIFVGIFFTMFFNKVTAGTNERENIRIGFNQSIDNKGVIYLNGFSSTFKGNENEIWPSDENISKGITGKKFGDKSAKSILVVMIDGKSYTAIDFGVETESANGAQATKPIHHATSHLVESRLGDEPVAALRKTQHVGA